MKINRLILFLISISLILTFVQAVEQTNSPTTSKDATPVVEIKTTEGITSTTDKTTGLTTYTLSATESSNNPAITIGKDTFMSFQPASKETKAFIEVDKEGKITAADLTAKTSTTWKFGEKSIELLEGQRVTLKDGKLSVFGKENEVVKIKTADSGDFREVTFKGKETSSFIFGTSNPNVLIIDGSHISGENFQIGGLFISKGGATIVNEGTLLDKSSISNYNSVAITNRDDLLFANSKDNFGNYKNAIYMDPINIKGKGSNFDLNFGVGNPYANCEAEDHFKISAISGAEFSLANRGGKFDSTGRITDSSGKIPLLTMKGDFKIEENGKAYTTGQDKFFIEKSLNSKSGTSPVELQVLDQDKKYIVTNFKGVAVVPLNIETGVTDQTYANSIYPQKASTEVRYNYPTAKDFTAITGKSMVFIGGSDKDVTNSLDNPTDIRTLIDAYENLPSIAKGGISQINIYSKDAYPYQASSDASYSPKFQSINIRGGDFTENCDSGICGFALFSHEASHAVDKYIATDTSNILNLVNKWDELNKESYNTGFSGLLRRGVNFAASGFNTMSPSNGFVSSYARSSALEDRAETRMVVVSDPEFFKKNGLLDSSNPYSSVYKAKIDFLLSNGYISQAEYDAVFR